MLTFFLMALSAHGLARDPDRPKDLSRMSMEELNDRHFIVCIKLS